MSNPLIELTGVVSNQAIVLNGVTGVQQQVTATGVVAQRGPAGIGVPVGGLIGQVLMKASNDPYSTEWASISPVDVGLPYFDVKAYGAFGDGSADDTVAFKAAAAAALAAGGGIVWIPEGEYIISDTLPLYAKVTYQGVGINASFIFMTDANKDAFYGEDVSSMNLKDFVIEGQGSGTGRGVAFERNVADNTPYIKCDAIWVRNFGGDGIFIDRPIVSSLDTVISADNGGHGFNQLNGTSTNYKNCFANNNDKAGYYGETHQYCGYASCAADSNGIGYYFHGCQGLEMSGGAEVTTSRGGSWDGTSIKIDACFVAQIRAPWIGQNAAVGIWVTGGSQNIEILGAEDNSPEGGATNFVKVDSGCIVTTDQIRNITANSFATGTTTVLNDGAGNMTIPHALGVGTDLTVGGTSYLATTNVYGNLTMEATTNLILSADPSSAFHAATKQYVDAAAASGGINRSISSISSPATAGATAKTDYVYFVSGTTTLTLPTAVSNTNRYSVTNSGSNTVTVATTSAQTINGSTTITLIPGQSVDLISNNANWSIF